MAQQPAVVIIARHGLRLDAADQSWHLQTPEPYNPPLTYGGWNQCRALGARIADILHTREQQLNVHDQDGSVESRDFTDVSGIGERSGTNEAPRKRRKIRHKVVVHSSPFLRCVQTSTALAAGMAQYAPIVEKPSKAAGDDRSHRPSAAGKATPRTAGIKTGGAEVKHDLVHEVARRALLERKRYRKSKLRVDAFLGEWLNPQYFENITPPPPSSMMVKAAKGELMQNEAVEVFTPATTSSGKTLSNGNLWNGNKSYSLDEWSDIQAALPAPTARRDARSRASTVSSDNSPVDSGRRSPFRPGSALSPLTSTLPKPELSIYQPPIPQHAVSSSDQIPRGYVAHARINCTNVDFQWDSSRPPQDWGDGGEYGEEWSAMHRRFRHGLSDMVRWYSQHDVDDRGEDALGFEQAERHGEREEEEREELVVVLVTHGAGCNALIGALTGQPVLLDVGMASLTMAVRKDDAVAEELTTATARSPGPEPTKGHGTRRIPDLNLSGVYEMKLTASTDHLRPTQDASRSASASRRPDSSHFKSFTNHTTPGTPPADGQPRSNTSSLLGSIRRPSAIPLSAPASSYTSRRNTGLDLSISNSNPQSPTMASFSTGLWTPPSGRTPLLKAQQAGKSPIVAPLGTEAEGQSAGDDMVLDFSTSPPDSRPGTSSGREGKKGAVADFGAIFDGAYDSSKRTATLGGQARDTRNEAQDVASHARDTMNTAEPHRSGLWGNGVEVKVEGSGTKEVKRRWTVRGD